MSFQLQKQLQEIAQSFQEIESDSVFDFLIKIEEDQEKDEKSLASLLNNSGLRPSGCRQISLKYQSVSQSWHGSIFDKNGNTRAYDHPERLPGEIFLTNVQKDSDFWKIGWKTKRKGQCAYDVLGRLVLDFYPVFVKEEEVLNEPD